MASGPPQLLIQPRGLSFLAAPDHSPRLSLERPLPASMPSEVLLSPRGPAPPESKASRPPYCSGWPLPAQPPRERRRLCPHAPSTLSLPPPAGPGGQHPWTSSVSQCAAPAWRRVRARSPRLAQGHRPREQGGRPNSMLGQGPTRGESQPTLGWWGVGAAR